MKLVQLEAFKPPVVYTTDCSKAMVPMLFLFCVALYFTLRGASCLVLPWSLSMCFFCPFSILITLFWVRGNWSLCLSCICLLAMHTLIRVTFSLPSGVMGWLRLLLVALPGLLCLPFLNCLNFQRAISPDKINGICSNVNQVTYPSFPVSWPRNKPLAQTDILLIIPNQRTVTPEQFDGNGSQVGWLVGWLCWGLTSQSTIFQSYRDGAIASWVINQYFRGVKCLAQGHNTAAVGLEPRTSRSGVRHSTTEPPRSPGSQVTIYSSSAIGWPSFKPLAPIVFEFSRYLADKFKMPEFSKGHHSGKIWRNLFKSKSCNLLIIPYQLTKLTKPQDPSLNNFQDILMSKFSKDQSFLL